MAVTVTCCVRPGLCPTDNGTQGTTEISSSDRATGCYSWDRAPTPILQAGQGLLNKHRELVLQSQQLPISSRYSFWHQSLRLLLHLCVVCLARSKPNKAKSAITTRHPVCGLQQIRFRSRFPSTNKQPATEATCIQLPCDGEVPVSQFPPEICPSIHLFPQGPHGRGPRPFLHRSYPNLLIRC